MKKIILFAIGMVIIFLETFFTNFINSYFSVNFLLIYIIFISFYIDKKSALILGGIIGLMSDMVSGGVVGITPLLFLATSYFISSIEKSIFKDKRNIVCFFVLLISIVFSILEVAVSAIFFNPNALLSIALKALVLLPVANTVVAFLAYTIFEDKLIKLREE
nr:rod shape-determining protein MreD [Peptostreptococcus faecalis]